MTRMSLSLLDLATVSLRQNPQTPSGASQPRVYGTPSDQAPCLFVA